MSKYIVVNGRVTLNPQFGSTEKTTVANPERALVCPCNVNDANSIADVTGGVVAPSTINTVMTVQDDNYVNKFGSGGRVDGGELLEQVSTIFTDIGAPIGLSNKLIGLQGFAINIKIDDSGSMGSVCSNRYTRWQNVEQRLLQFMKLLQVVPTRTVTLSFLDRRNVISLNRQGQTPQEFFNNASQQIQQAFRSPPQGNTPIYANVYQMLQSTQGPTAHYLFTDGIPSDSRYTSEQEIQLTKNALTGRWNPQQNSFTFLCCSDNPLDTVWMHEVESIACRPGTLGYVAALQNFQHEQLEVLNDQGPTFPYSEAMWLLCNLTAALNPNDLDALDQHAPLSKPTLDNIIGHVTTAGDYESYFNSHPNANWLFCEDYALFLSAEITSRIPAVNFFETFLGNQLSADIDSGDDTSEPRAIAKTEESLLRQFNRQRPDHLRRARQDFWYNHYLRMEQLQSQYTVSIGTQAKQDLWGDYVAASGLRPVWQGFAQGCRSTRSASGNGTIVSTSPAEQPPAYTQAVGPNQQQPAYQPYTNPDYYQVTAASVPSSNYYGGGNGGNYSSSCCSII